MCFLKKTKSKYRAIHARARALKYLQVSLFFLSKTHFILSSSSSSSSSSSFFYFILLFANAKKHTVHLRATCLIYGNLQKRTRARARVCQFPLPYFITLLIKKNFPKCTTKVGGLLFRLSVVFVVFFFFFSVCTFVCASSTTEKKTRTLSFHQFPVVSEQ